MSPIHTIALLLSVLVAAAPVIERGVGADVLRTPTAANPYDPDQIKVDVLIVLPNGQARRQPAFWYVPMERWQMSGKDKDGRPLTWERFRPTGAGEWRFRYTPPLAGKYAWSWVVETPVSSTVIDGGAFVLRAQPALPGPLRVAAHGRGFVRPGGGPWVPLGENMGWPRDGGSGDFQAWLRPLAAAGGNCARIWLTHYFVGTTLEWSPTGVNDGYGGAGHFSQESAARLDHVFAAAADHDVYLLLSLNSFGDTTWDWERHPYSRAAGGWLDDPAKLWTDNRARRHFRARLRYLVARYGWSPYLWAWEFWNEMEAAAGYDAANALAWHREMIDYLHHLDRDRHLITSSYTWIAPSDPAPVFALPTVDFTQTHIYDSQPIDGIFWGLKNLTRFGKPSLVAEAGLGVHPNYFDADPAGLNVHDMLWTGVLAGSAGGALTWWWDNYVQPRDLYYHFTGISRALAGIDPAGGTPLDVKVQGRGEWFAMARQCGDTTLGWFGPNRQVRRGWDGADYRVYLYRAPNHAAADSVDVPGNFAGPRSVQWLDPYDGVVIGRATIEGTADGIRLVPPPCRHDLAFRIGGRPLADGPTPLHDRFAAAHDDVAPTAMAADETDQTPAVPAHGPGGPTDPQLH